VAELKKRLRELGFKVPSSIVEKSELLSLVQEAERQANEHRGGSAEPTAPKTSTAFFKLCDRLKELGIEVPPSATDEDTLLKLLRDAEQKAADVKVETVLAQDIAVTCTRGSQGVRRIDLSSQLPPQMPQDDAATAEGAIRGALFTWVRGDCIGHGASGTVFRALEQSTGQLMAVKEVHMDLQRKVDARVKEALETAFLCDHMLLGGGCWFAARRP